MVRNPYPNRREAQVVGLPVTRPFCTIEIPCLKDLDVLLEGIAELTDIRSMKTMILLATKFERPDMRMRPFRWASRPLSHVHADEWGAK